MDFRPLTPADLPAVMRLEQSMPGSLMWEPAKEEDQSSIIRDGNNFGIFDSNVLVGKVGFWDTKTEGWEVDGMIIDTKFRGKHYGSVLFTSALLAITAKEHPSVFVLYTHPANSPAIAIYLKSGFTIQEWVPDKYGPGKPRIKMTKPTS